MKRIRVVRFIWLLGLSGLRDVRVIRDTRDISMCEPSIIMVYCESYEYYFWCMKVHRCLVVSPSLCACVCCLVQVAFCCQCDCALCDQCWGEVHCTKINRAHPRVSESEWKTMQISKLLQGLGKP
jgi:hypothetical protein